MAESKLAHTDLAAQAADREMMPLLAKLIKDAKATPTADEELLLKMPVVKEMTIFFNELFSGEPPKKIYDDILAYVRKRYGHLVSNAGKAAAAEKAKAAEAEAARKKEEAAAAKALAAEEAKRALALKKEMDAEARKAAEAKRKAEAEADAARKKAMEANLKDQAARDAVRDAARKKEAEADRQKAEKMQKELDDAERARQLKNSPGKCLCCDEYILEKEYLQDEEDIIHVKCRPAYAKIAAERAKARAAKKAAADRKKAEEAEGDKKKAEKMQKELDDAERARQLKNSPGKCVCCNDHILEKEYLKDGNDLVHVKCRADFGRVLADRKKTAAAEDAKRNADQAVRDAARKKEATEQAAREAARQKARDEEEAKRKANLARSVGQCIHCKAPIMDKEYLALGDKKLHKGCLKNYESFMKNKCEQCGDGLVGDYIEFGAKGAGWGVKLHDECLTAYKKATRPDCAKCGIQILDNKRLEVRGQHYHVACVPK